jgi:hypothetical protein
MAHRILTAKGEVVIRKSVWALTHDDLAIPAIQERIAGVKQKVTSRFGDHLKENEIPNGREIRVREPPEGLFKDKDLLDEPEEPELCARDAEDLEDEYGDYDHYINAQVTIPKHGMPGRATVVARKMGGDGKPVGRGNPNPILDTHEYKVH